MIEAYAETPRTSANEIYVLTVMDPDSEYPWNRTGAHRGLYFHRIEEIRENEIVRRSPYLGIYKRGHWSGYNFVYELYFENEIVVNQKVCSYSDGIVLLPRCFFVDLDLRFSLYFMHYRVDAFTITHAYSYASCPLALIFLTDDLFCAA